MNDETTIPIMRIISKIRVSYQNQLSISPIPQILLNAYRIAIDHFNKNRNNKLCLVFPIKEVAAQWLALLFALNCIYTDYKKFKNQIFESYKNYRKGDLLILNNDAIVKWEGYDEKYIKFSTKPKKNASEPIRFAKHEDVIKLQPAPANKKSVSIYKKVIHALQRKTNCPLDTLLGINSEGNRQFMRTNVCLISKFKDYDTIFNNISINRYPIENYIIGEKISEDGKIKNFSSLLVSNNFERAIELIEEKDSITKLIIDGFNHIYESTTNFIDVDKKQIPTILITDLKEIDTFEKLAGLDFEFYNFTKENIDLENCTKENRFFPLDVKLRNYITFNSERIICKNDELESAAKLLQNIEQDETNVNLITLRNSQIKIINRLARICYMPNNEEIDNYFKLIKDVSMRFEKFRAWLGDAEKSIGNIISKLNCFVNQLSEIKTDKCLKFENLLQNNYHYVVCPTTEEENSLKKHLNSKGIKIIQVSELNNNLLENKEVKAILTGWPRSNNFNKIVCSFILNKLTVLFYPFEHRYYNSLQRRNLKNIKNIIKHAEMIAGGFKGYENIFSVDDIVETNEEQIFDVIDFELKIDDTQYSKYYAKGTDIQSCKAKRIDFENNKFIYATESHKFIIVREFENTFRNKPSIVIKKLEDISYGDIIAIINTDKDILVEMVKKVAAKEDYAQIKSWIDLWKDLLEKKFAEINYDFPRLVRTLRRYRCTKHAATIRTWVNEENMIGPEDDADLKAIARMTNSNYLLENISKVRKAIRTMTSWRMKAAEIIRNKIKHTLMEIKANSIVNNQVEIHDLGGVVFLKVVDLQNKSEEIDRKFVNRLLEKEIV